MITTLALTLVLAAHTPDEINSLIQKLDSDSYEVRQAAEDELISLERDALEPCRKAAKATSNPEIRSRCRRVVNAYYCVTNSEGYLPKIGQMDNEMAQEIIKVVSERRDFKGQNLPDFYRSLAESRLPPYDAFQSWNIHQWEIQQLAVRIMVVDLREEGWSRTKVQELLDKMTKITDSHYYYGES